MSERKVLNKYYPPDFDPSKIPRMKLARNRQYTVRLMAPFNMRCKTCGEYIYKGKKFNARKEDVEEDTYLGIRIYRFYIKCTRCLQEISFKTDPKNTDYEIEAGATRNFMALKMAEEQAQREKDEEKEEEATNPMKLLEKRTQQSKHELELLESLEELKDLNRRHQAVDYDEMLGQYDNEANRKRKEKEQEELDEQLVQSIFKKKGNFSIVEEEIIEIEEENESARKIFKKDDEKTDSEKLDTFTKPLEANKPTTSSSLWAETKKTNLTKTILSGLVRRKTDIVKVNASTTNPSEKKLISKTDEASKETPKPSGLSLLGAYSDSEDEND